MQRKKAVVDGLLALSTFPSQTPFTMTRSLLLACSIGLSTIILAQEDKAPQVVKSEAMEMQVATTPSITFTEILPQTKVEVIGLSDVAPAPAACDGTADQARVDCLGREVLKAIQEKLKTAGVAADDSGYPVSVAFALNEYGEVRSVQVERTGGTDISKHVIVALNGIRDFRPATQEDTPVGVGIRITYPAELLFGGSK
ncbi:MAG TPA: hypothetical protein PLV08_02560 [Flavobacteriales bacterium]|jgi:hypothetical protein|nr:hypothetical protein [Flavobacteriales bacterium]MBK8707796.1 hypothetical protein [Flavobacteriales bacterium]MBK9629229.1 hypothetical protein [Flavobacteriales bacterium]MBP8877675.1 hypothetical protein [Flavobacteriales bacterium]HQW04527.1 hypothetical protein [Flavobacteriales bacterium]